MAEAALDNWQPIWIAQVSIWTPVCVDSTYITYIHTYIHTLHTCLLLISMLWHRQALFESKRDKLSHFVECRIRTQRVSETDSPADWMPVDKPTELSRIKLKSWTQQPVPMIGEHSAHSTPLPFAFRTWLCRYRCLLLLISMPFCTGERFSNRKEASCLPLLNARFEPGSLEPNLQQTECRWQTDWAIEHQLKTLEINSPSLWSASIQPTRPHCHLAFAPGSGDLHVCCC